MIVRRCIALVLLGVVLIFQTESLGGMLEAGAVDYASLDAEAIHDGSREFLDGTVLPCLDQAPVVQHSQNEPHHHPKFGDHCTHQHAVEVTAPGWFAVWSTLSFRMVWPTPDHVERIPQGLFRPPRA